MEVVDKAVLVVPVVTHLDWRFGRGVQLAADAAIAELRVGVRALRAADDALARWRLRGAGGGGGGGGFRRSLRRRRRLEEDLA